MTENDYLKLIGEKLTEIRKANGTPCNAAAKNSSICTKKLSEMEKGKPSYGAITLVKHIMKICGTDVLDNLIKDLEMCIPEPEID